MRTDSKDGLFPRGADRLRPILMLLGAVSFEAAAAETSASPVEIGGAYVVDVLSNTAGGLRQGTAVLGLLELSAEIDGDAIGLDGVAGYLNLQYAHGRSLSGELVGDAQVVSNIEAPPALRPFEAWIEAPLSKGVSIRTGLIDLNGEFDVQRVGQLFLNSSHGIGPDFSQSGLNGPSIFPTTSLAVSIRAAHRGWTARAGLFDAVAGDPNRPKRTRIRFPGRQGLLAVLEVERAIGSDVAVKGGLWTYTGRFDSLAERDADGEPVRRRGNRGAYMTVEGKLADADGDRSLDAWLRVGVAESRLNPIGTYVGGGASWGSEESRLGFAVAHARLGAAALTSIPGDGARLRQAETKFELTYSHRLTSWLTVQPDAQYIVNPGWRPDLGDALVLGARLIFETR